MSLIGLNLTSCTTTSDHKSQDESVFALPTTSRTPLPLALSNFHIPQTTLVIPPGMVLCSRTIRPYVVLKTGPGEQFPNQDTMLKKGALVVLSNDSSFWKKIYVPQFKLSGWVHAKTLSTSYKNSETIKIHTKDLPIVTTVTQKARLSPYPTGTSTTIIVPRGLALTKIGEGRQKQLVWVPGKKKKDFTSVAASQTQSNIFWIDRRDAW